MQFNEIIAAKLHAEKLVKESSNVLASYPRSTNGLVPDSVRTSPEYKHHKQVYDNAFRSLQSINTSLMMHHKREYLAWRKGNKG